MDMPSFHRDQNSTNQFGFLESILARAIDPAAIEDVLQQFAIETTLETPELTEVTSYSRARIVVINDIAYILCPVPQFYNEENRLETGFAIDVDQDHFDVYPFLFNTSTGEYKILTRLPHCVVRAIKMDARSYQDIDDELKEVANEVSAMLFISNLYTELEVGADSPVEFFDDRLFQQLLGKVLSVDDPAWMNTRLVRTRFDLLRTQVKCLDDEGSSRVERQRRVFSNMARFLVETIRVIGVEKMLVHVDKDVVIEMSDQMLTVLVEANDLAIGMELASYMSQFADASVFKTFYAFLVARGLYDRVMALERVIGVNLSKDQDVIQKAFSVAIEEGLANQIPELESFFGEKYRAAEATINRACNDLVRKGKIENAMALEKMVDMSCKLEDAVVRDAFDTLLHDGHVIDAIKLVQWAGIDWHLEPAFVQQVIGMLVQQGNIADARAFETFSGITYVPIEDVIEKAYATIFHEPGKFLSKLDIAKQLMNWTGIPLLVTMIPNVYRGIFSAPGKNERPVQNAVLLEAWTGVMPSDDLVQELYGAIFQAMRDNERLFDEARQLGTWTGVMPSRAMILSECKHYLKIQQFKASNVAMACKLIEWTGVIPPESVIQDTFSALLAAPLKNTAIDDAAMLSCSTRMKPSEDVIQETYTLMLEYRVIDAKTMPVDAAKRFQSWTGVEPSQDVATRGLNAAIIRLDIPSAKVIVEWTGVKPGKDIVLDAFKSSFQNPRPDGAWYHDVQELESWTGIVPGEDIVQEAYDALLLRRRISPESIDAAALIASFTGAKPSEEILYKVQSVLAREEDLGYEREETTKALHSWMERLEME